MNHVPVDSNGRWLKWPTVVFWDQWCQLISKVHSGLHIKSRANAKIHHYWSTDVQICQSNNFLHFQVDYWLLSWSSNLIIGYLTPAAIRNFHNVPTPWTFSPLSKGGSSDGGCCFATCSLLIGWNRYNDNTIMVYSYPVKAKAELLTKSLSLSLIWLQYQITDHYFRLRLALIDLYGLTTPSESEREMGTEPNWKATLLGIAFTWCGR